MSTHTAAIRQLMTAIKTAKGSLIDLKRVESNRFLAAQLAISSRDRAQADVLTQMRLIERLEASITALESLDEPVDGDGE